MAQSFKDLVAGQRSIELTIGIYRLTSGFPDSERFRLTNQMRRASVSIASNIAEGYGRSTKGEYVQFLGHARGSCSELETQIVIARKIGFGAPANLDSADSLCNEVGRMLCGLIKSIRAKQSASPSP
jgi:four helix bundle protein